MLTSQRAQAQAPAHEPLYRISGTVVNAATGEPVARAAVAVLNIETHRTVASAVTDKAGHFALSGLAAAKYEFTASKRGFLTTFYEQHENFSSAIVTGEGQETEHMTFRISPGAALAVTVSGEGGDPVAGAKVLLFKRVHDAGLGRRIVPAGQFATEDDGTASIYNLEPGEYLVAIQAEPWFAMHAAKRPGSGMEKKTLRKANPALDVVYPVTFFDGVTDESAAAPLQLFPGSRERIAIVLQAVPALHLLVPLPGASSQKAPDGEEENVSTSSLQLSIFGLKLPGVESLTADQSSDGVEEYTGIAPGHYELQTGPPRRILEFDATADRQLAANTGAPAAELHATLHAASGSDLPVQPLLLLRNTDSSHPQELPVIPCGPDECFLDALPPGEWQLTLMNGDHNLPILSIANHGHTHSGNLIRATDKPLDLTLTVADATVNLEGFAQQDGKGKAGVMVVLVPQNPAAHSDLFRRDQSDSDGSFSLHDLAPGAYTLIAIEDGWNLEWQRPEVLARFLSHGIPVQISAAQPGTPQTQHLSTPVPVQDGFGKLAPASASSPESPAATSSKQGGEGSL